MKIFLCGDVMLGRGIDQIERHSVDPCIHEGYMKDARKYVTIAEDKNGKIPRGVSEDYIWGDALSIWKKKSPDLKIVNLETSITTNETFIPKGINYRMHPQNVSLLLAAGIDICALSNNHILDWNHQGMSETLEVLNKTLIKHSGAGLTLKEAQAPAIFENESGRVLVFSISHASSGVPMEWMATESRGGVFLINSLSEESVQMVRSVIESYKKKDDVVVVSLHWGGNWGYDVSKKESHFAHALIDQAFVDILHGHSSHHPKPLEIYNGRPIFYGCGDFINDYEG
ncbi:MAG: CapA family protein, partial [Bacteriovorax sp.]